MSSQPPRHAGSCAVPPRCCHRARGLLSGCPTLPLCSCSKPPLQPSFPSPFPPPLPLPSTPPTPPPAAPHTRRRLLGSWRPEAAVPQAEHAPPRMRAAPAHVNGPRQPQRPQRRWRQHAPPLPLTCCRRRPRCRLRRHHRRYLAGRATVMAAYHWTQRKMRAARQPLDPRSRPPALPRLRRPARAAPRAPPLAQPPCGQTCAGRCRGAATRPRAELPPCRAAHAQAAGKDAGQALHTQKIRTGSFWCKQVKHGEGIGRRLAPEGVPCAWCLLERVHSLRMGSRVGRK
eukprot:366256-Chlamydomonas_euryale.AAC.23